MYMILSLLQQMGTEERLLHLVLASLICLGLMCLLFIFKVQNLYQRGAFPRSLNVDLALVLVVSLEIIMSMACTPSGFYFFNFCALTSVSLAVIEIAFLKGAPVLASSYITLAEEEGRGLKLSDPFFNLLALFPIYKYSLGVGQTLSRLETRLEKFVIDLHLTYQSL